MPTEAELRAILDIAHDTSLGGEGLSLNEAMARARYAELRKTFDRADLVPILRAHPELVEKWLQWCDDKRTSGGWWVTDEGEIGRLSSSERIQHRDLAEAIADYVIRELDFWANVGRGNAAITWAMGALLVAVVAVVIVWMRS